ncbi:MAG: hypothetical protein JJ964_16050 [Rhizobiales bacterium]|nr:hypothetical protein [Hyphomicrobiales bacterium]
MKKRTAWCKLPTEWIVNGNLKKFKTSSTEATSSAAALMCLTVIAHEADPESGIARVTYSQFESALSKSRKTIASGLRKLEKVGLVITGKTQSERALIGYNPSKGWGKFPCKSLYKNDEIEFFSACTLRQRSELDAIKMLFLIVAFRDQSRNLAMISYDKVTEIAGIPRERIKTAISLLAANGIVFVEHVPSSTSDYGIVNGYRLRGIEPYNHYGTRGRSEIIS